LEFGRLDLFFGEHGAVERAVVKVDWGVIPFGTDLL
jgi:hypothetical protein